MHLSFVLLALSTLAAAGPLPSSYSNATLAAGPAQQIPTNITLTVDPVAVFDKLKMIYDGLNQTEHNAVSNVKNDFWTWLQDSVAEEEPGLQSRSMPAANNNNNNTLDSESVKQMLILKAIYDRRNETDQDATAVVKRGWWSEFGHWLKMTFEAPGLGG